MQNYFEMSTKSAYDIRRIHILKWKMQQLLGPQMGPWPLVYRLMYRQIKLNFKNKFVQMPKIFCIEIDIL